MALSAAELEALAMRWHRQRGQARQQHAERLAASSMPWAVARLRRLASPHGDWGERTDPDSLAGVVVATCLRCYKGRGWLRLLNVLCRRLFADTMRSMIGRRREGARVPRLVSLEDLHAPGMRALDLRIRRWVG